MTETEFMIGGVRICPSRNIMIGKDARISLEPRIMDVLHGLAKQPLEVVTRDAIISGIWNVDYGGDESLTRAISILRKSFKKAGLFEKVIETIPKRGYRLVIKPSISTYEPTGQTQVTAPRASKETAQAAAAVTALAQAPVSALQAAPAAGIPPVAAQREVKTVPVFPALLSGLIFAAICTVGLNQFMNREKPNPPSPADILSTMVFEGKLTPTQVIELENILTPSPAKKIVTEAEKQQYLAMAAKVDPSAFVEGLDNLEAIATNFQDWKTIAELSISRDPNRSVRAAQQGLLLKPRDFQMLTLHAQALGAAGRLLEARTTGESLRRIASTKREKIMAEYAFLNIQMMIGNEPDIRLAYESYANAIESFRNISSMDLPGGPLTNMAIDEDPTWSLGVSFQVKAQAEGHLKEYALAIESLSTSTEYFKAVAPRLQPSDAIYVYLRFVSNHQATAKSYAALDRHAQAIEFYEKNLKVLDDIDAMDPGRSDIRRPDTWADIAKISEIQNDRAATISAYKKAIQGYEILLETQPGHSSAFKQLTLARKARQRFLRSASDQ